MRPLSFGSAWQWGTRGDGPAGDRCFDQALEDVGLAHDEQLRRVLHDYFAWATTTTMAKYHESPDDVPDGLHPESGPGKGSLLQRKLMIFDG